MSAGNGRVVSVGAHSSHAFSKPLLEEIKLVAGLGVEGDAHMGATVKHRSRVRVDPTQPNLRQVHLVQSELFAELSGAGFQVRAGDLGENVATTGVDLLALPRGAMLRLGPEAIVQITGLRNPCKQINHFQDGLLQAVLERTDDGRVIRKAGVMGIVMAGGKIRPGDAIVVELPPEPRLPLEPV
jgi:MOSC domain-containing protein YiiM